MGGKGPIVIVGMGIVGLAMFAWLANWLVDNNPVLQDLTRYRQQVADEYPCERVVFSHDGPDYTLKVWVDVPSLPTPIASKSELPRPFSELTRHFAGHYQPPQPARSVTVQLLRPVGGGAAVPRRSCVRRDTISPARPAACRTGWPSC